MGAHQATVDVADFWHVALAPGETKVLTLEQLDDLFRLDIIDAATRVWQPGMSEWLPLAVVAGLEAEPSKPKAAPPAPSSRAPARPPSPPQRPATTASFGATPARPVSFQPAAAPLAAQWPDSAAPAQLAAPWPGSAAPTPSFRPTPESVRPIVVSHRPAPIPSGGGAGGRFVLALAFLAGIGVTLYRNDILRQAAVSAGQGATYMKVEAALGGPGFGTPRAVELASPTSLNAAVAAAGSQASAPSSPQPPSVAELQPAKEPARAAEPEKSGASDAKALSPVSLSSLVAAQITAPKAKAERPTPARSAPTRSAPARPATRAASGGAEPSRGLGIKGSSNGYDPLNGKL